jgi:transcriptional regulator with XRE-family HTH domain
MRNNFEDSHLLKKQQENEILVAEQKREDEIKMEMGKLLKKIRVRQGLDIKVIAEKKTFEKTTIYNVEKGIAFPSKTTLKKLLSVYQMTEEEKQKIAALHIEITTIRDVRKKRNLKKRYQWG